MRQLSGGALSGCGLSLIRGEVSNVVSSGVSGLASEQYLGEHGIYSILDVRIPQPAPTHLCR